MFILNKCPSTYNQSKDNGNLYVSVIDVEMLWETNQTFYVPLLDFLKPGEWSYPHKYLVHGVVRGPWHKAVPYESFTDLRISDCVCFCKILTPIEPLTEACIQRARNSGELFGDEFALPITLASMSCKRRDRDVWMHGVSKGDLKSVLHGIKGLKVPES